LAGLLVTTEQETLLPGRDLGRIPLQEILAVARTANSVHGDNRSLVPAPVISLCSELESLWRERLGGETLESWLSGSR
jgi:hypothetical protein